MASYTSNPFIDALTVGFRASNTVIDYYLAPSGGAWTQVEADAFARATALWSEVAGIRFRRVYDPADADFSESIYSDAGSPGSLGSHELYIGDGKTIMDIEIGRWGTLDGLYNRAGYGWDENDPNGGLVRGGLGFTTILHEIGHGIGLDHSHADHVDDPHVFPGVGTDTSAWGEHGLNAELYTLMSYRDGPDLRPTYAGMVHNWGKAGGPMTFDIAAIQNLYGANTTTRTGDDIYVLPAAGGIGTYWTAIWDAGGTDTIVHGGGEDAVINLQSATLENAPGGGGYLSRVGNTYGGFTVAQGVVIENGIGGSGADTLRGNDAANRLNGREGVDTILGADGNDTLEGAAGQDNLAGGTGDDLLFASTEAAFSNYDWFEPFGTLVQASSANWIGPSTSLPTIDSAGEDGLFV
ncbi:M10 family metallopeptidase C-terminal domain-containing protein [Palleronia sp.]|uniref:M10 family metallopeptidase C-terminal domain-containing protein n=1 Tax=Palleronia sp. TaxID=1940284 RepID=UPI0035C7D5B2